MATVMIPYICGCGFAYEVDRTINARELLRRERRRLCPIHRSRTPGRARYHRPEMLAAGDPFRKE